ncbi:antimicrobial peptide NK-lysin-like [Ursus americanus]|uniref:antimicrobial peptide NK-lysin-like n=1 Tax=Ursus americanus TaxID=9643 RepID=UPI001E67BAB5|nr:antimicrobial peptide NK-lysin-like [Ursus americanus]
MTSWALLLLASALLATPGLTFSGQSPEDHDLSMADMSEEEQFFEILAREALKSDPKIFICKPCKFMIKMLRKILGEDIDEEAIKQAASKLCRKTLMPKMLCNDVIGKYLGAITQGILNDKSPQEICVKIRMCRAKIGLGAPGALADPGEKHRIFSDHRQLLPS